MYKTDNPYYEKIKKVTKGKYLIGGNYELRVINECKKQGLPCDFQSLESTKGVPYGNTLLYNEKLNKYYLKVEYFTKVPSKSEFFFEGNTIDKTMFESYLSKKSDSSRQPQDRKVIRFDYSIDSIRECSLNGIKYEIE